MLRAKAAGVVAFKLYPAGATTNSDSGVTDISLVMPTLRTMAQVLHATQMKAHRPETRVKHIICCGWRVVVTIEVYVHALGHARASMCADRESR